jgi:hypothetical protein
MGLRQSIDSAGVAGKVLIPDGLGVSRDTLLSGVAGKGKWLRGLGLRGA